MNSMTLLLPILLFGNGVTEKPKTPSCGFFSYTFGGVPQYVQSMGVLQTIAVAGPNGPYEFSPPDDDQHCTAPNLVSLESVKLISHSGIDSNESFDVCDYDAHANLNGSGEANSKSNYKQEIEADGCHIEITGTIDCSVSGNAEVNQEICPYHPNPSPKATASGSGNVFNVIQIPFAVKEKGSYSLYGNIKIPQLSSIHISTLEGSAKVIKGNGELVGEISLSCPPPGDTYLGYYLGDLKHIDIELDNGFYYLTYVFNADLASSEAVAECNTPPDWLDSHGDTQFKFALWRKISVPPYTFQDDPFSY